MMLFRSNRFTESLTPLEAGHQAHLGTGDRALWVWPVIMTMFGLVMVYSATLFVTAENNTANWFYLARQTSLVLIGLAALLAGMFVDVDKVRRFAKLGMLVFIVLMVLQLAFAPLVKATRRWIPILGLTFQTSEFARVAVIAFMARMLADDATLALKISKRLLIVLIPVGLICLLTFAQRDLSGAAMIMALPILLFYLAGMDKRQFWMVTGGGALVTGVAAMVLPYTRRRIVGFAEFLLNFDTASVADENYQTFQSMIGFGRGGIFGVGLGDGKQKMAFLPELHTDFIYSNVGEELGLLGAVAVLGSFLYLYIRSLRVLKNQTDRFAFLFGSGLIASLLMFAMTHMAVTVGLIPVTGLPLPFISNGGSSLLVSLWSMGFLWQLSRRAASFE